jgi:hypothetical protein
MIMEDGSEMGFDSKKCGLEERGLEGESRELEEQPESRRQVAFFPRAKVAPRY